MSPGERLRARLQRPPALIAPGVYDALTAWLATRAGYELLFVPGSALSYSLLARPDAGLLGALEVAEAVARITARVDTPLLVDIDTGFGSVAAVARTTRLIEAAGAAGVQIEDQLAMKPPGALHERPLAPLHEMLDRLDAAQNARRDPAFVISARTDAAPTAGVDEALRRAEAFAAAGADMIFVEGLPRRADVEAVAAALGGRVTLVANVLEGRDAPVADPTELASLGFGVILRPATLIHAAAAAYEQALAELATPRGACIDLDAKGLSERLESAAYLAGFARPAA